MGYHLENKIKILVSAHFFNTKYFHNFYPLSLTQGGQLKLERAKKKENFFLNSKFCLIFKSDWQNLFNLSSLTSLQIKTIEVEIDIKLSVLFVGTPFKLGLVITCFFILIGLKMYSRDTSCMISDQTNYSKVGSGHLKVSLYIID